MRSEYGDDVLAALLYGDELFHRGPLYGRGLDAAVDVLLDAAHRDRDFSPALEHALWALIRLGREAEARETLARLEAAAGPGARRDDASYIALLRRAFAARFGSSGPVPRELPELTDTIQVFVTRVGLGFDVPETQLVLGERLFRARAPAAMRGNGALAHALALLATGRAEAALEWLDSAAVRLGAEAHLQAVQWRVVPGAVGWHVVPETEVAEARSRLEDDWARVQPARVYWTLALDALESGDATRAAPWKGRLLADTGAPEAAGEAVPDSDAFVTFLAAAEAAARRDYEGALQLSAPLQDYDRLLATRDPFFRAVLYLSRGTWHEQLGMRDAAEREWLWSENNDIAGWLDAAAEPVEVDWVLPSPPPAPCARCSSACPPSIRSRSPSHSPYASACPSPARSYPRCAHCA